MFSGREKSLEGFVVADGGWLKVKSDSAFADDPVNFLRLFHVAQENDLDIHPATLRLITQNLQAHRCGCAPIPRRTACSSRC